MSITGIGAGYPAGRKVAGFVAAGKAQRSGSGTGFAGRMANVVGMDASENGRKTSAASRRDNYVGGDAASIYGKGVYYRKDISASQNINRTIETERYKIDFRNGSFLADKESEMADSKEAETKTQIIVQPDGSRVLVMTMSIGGMETAMSLEISKPTEAPNENSKQDTDNNMLSADTEMDTVSDE
ncbi:MAG: hypothetical protein K2O40_05120 [Lachnospiraceae bacterium]|nr:hypothetical protein [Lachnospiraceae bacterium]